MQRLLSLVFNANDLKFRCDDDYIDRLSRRHSVTILIMFSLVVTTTIYVGSPITCWAPAEFTDSHKSYANTICWVTNTYFVPFGRRVPHPDDKDSEPMITYYQWTPIILMLQAVLCYLPSVFWRVLSRKSGLNIPAVMEAAATGQRSTYTDIREKTIRYIVGQVDRYLGAKKTYSRKKTSRKIFTKLCCLCFGKVYGHYLTLCYILIKICYLCNAVVQLFLLDYFMGNNFQWYGIEMLTKLFDGEDWAANDRFPRVTLCFFKVRHMSTNRDYIVQCVLPINLFNEKIFLFVWFWLLLISILTGISLLKWCWLSIYTPGNVVYVKRQLKPLEGFKSRTSSMTKFTTQYLRRDGMFIIRLLNHNIGHLVTTEILNGLWENYAPEKTYMSDIDQLTDDRASDSTTLKLGIPPPSRLQRLKSI